MSNYGLKLIGTICASNIMEGKTKDEGRPYCRRTAMISTGSQVFEWSESCDPSVQNKPYPIDNKVVEIDVDYAMTQNGMTRVRGPLTWQDKKS